MSTPSNEDLLQLRAAAAQAEAEAAQARADALKAALAAAEAAASSTAAQPEPAQPPQPEAPEAPEAIPAASTSAPPAPEPTPTEPGAPALPDPSPSGTEAAPVPAPATTPAATDATPSGSKALTGYPAEIASAYTFAGGTIPLGALLVDGTPEPTAQIGFPLAMLNRHGLVAGATGTGKTRTLQAMAEGISAAGVPVFLADIKGDLSGMLAPGNGSEKLLARTASIGQDWAAQPFPVEPYSLGGMGIGTPIRTTVTDFGPLLLSKVLDLNETQESSLGLVFHWADTQGLALLDLVDLRATISYLTSPEGKAELADIGGVSSATAGVILRKLVALEAQGAEAFFGEPAFDVADLLRVGPDGRGVVSALELPAVADRPALFSTFLMWLLAELYSQLPEVGDQAAPRLVFFFDEAHLLFTGASKSFLTQVVQTVRLIRSKGVGVFFVTQSPKDVPADVLAQLGNRVQHALRAFTPQDASALRAAVRTYPTSPYDLEKLLQSLGTGEAVVTGLGENGAPTPVAWTRVRAPQSAMDPVPDDVLERAVAASPMASRYGTRVDNVSAYELLTERLALQEQAQAAEAARVAAEKDAAERAAAAEKEAKARAKELEKMRRDLEKQAAAAARAGQPRTRSTATRATSSRSSGSPLDSFLKSAGTQLGREITRSIFGTRRR